MGLEQLSFFLSSYFEPVTHAGGTFHAIVVSDFPKWLSMQIFLKLKRKRITFFGCLPSTYRATSQHINDIDSGLLWSAERNVRRRRERNIFAFAWKADPRDGHGLHTRPD
jgi:hypothetical protein